MTPGTQLGMPPWEPSTGNLNVNHVGPPPPGLIAEGLRGLLPTLPPGPPVRPTYLTGQPQYTTGLHPSPYPYPQQPYGTSQFPYYIYSHPQYAYTTPSGYYHPSMVHPGALEPYTHLTPGYVLPPTQPIPVTPPLPPFPRLPPVSSGRNLREPLHVPFLEEPNTLSHSRDKSVSDLRGRNLEPEFNKEDSERSRTAKSVERSVSRDSSRQPRPKSVERVQFTDRHRTAHRGPRPAQKDSRPRSHRTERRVTVDLTQIEELVRKAVAEKMAEMESRRTGIHPQPLGIDDGPFSREIYEDAMPDFKFPLLSSFRGSSDSQDPQSFICGFHERLRL